jgi:hypothetical protein
MRRVMLTVSVSCAVLAVGAASLAAGLAQEKPVARGGKDYCVICHEGLGGRLKKPVVEWRASMHDGAGGKCNICHGGNAGVNNSALAKRRRSGFVGRPDKILIADICGRKGCHAGEAAEFKLGPHFPSVLMYNRPNCTTCHGVHEIRRSTAGVISEKTCASCHTRDFSKEMVTFIADTERGIAETSRNIGYISGKHAGAGNLRKRLDAAEGRFYRFVHVSPKEETMSIRNLIKVEISSLEAESETKISQITNINLLYITMVAFLLIFIGGISIYMLVMYGKRRK